jgi:NNP family nitrate/nitrite transporter-like MFS transporter
MPSTSLFFPKRLQGTALGIQAGIGNFGVSAVQFITPWVIGFALVGSAQRPTGGGDEIWLQNAVLFWVPLVVFFSVVAWLRLKSVPVRANVREQFDIFGEKHTWLMTSLYVMTFGSFQASPPRSLCSSTSSAGFTCQTLSAFLGPLVGSISASAAASDFGGGRLAQISASGWSSSPSPYRSS